MRRERKGERLNIIQEMRKERKGESLNIIQEMRRERKGERLSLTDLLAKPHQRIPRYRLLIQVKGTLSTKPTFRSKIKLINNQQNGKQHKCTPRAMYTLPLSKIMFGLKFFISLNYFIFP